VGGVVGGVVPRAYGRLTTVSPNHGEAGQRGWRQGHGSARSGCGLGKLNSPEPFGLSCTLRVSAQALARGVRPPQTRRGHRAPPRALKRRCQLAPFAWPQHWPTGRLGRSWRVALQRVGAAQGGHPQRRACLARGGFGSGALGRGWAGLGAAGLVCARARRATDGPRRTGCGPEGRPTRPNGRTCAPPCDDVSRPRNDVSDDNDVSRPCCAGGGLPPTHPNAMRTVLRGTRQGPSSATLVCHRQMAPCTPHALPSCTLLCMHLPVHHVRHHLGGSFGVGLKFVGGSGFARR
jgi:hypothetical protein